MASGAREAESSLPAPPEGSRGWPWTLDGTPGAREISSDLPSFGIVVPSYNQGRFLEATLRSLLLQGYPKLEVIVLDGGSSDESVSVLRKYEAWLDYWVSERDAGQSDAIARGIERSSAVWCGWLNSDDLLLPGALFAVAGHVTSHAGCELVAGDGVFVHEDGESEMFVQRSAEHDLDALLDYGGGRFLPQPSVFFRRELFQRVGGVDRALRYAMDLDLWLRMRKAAELCYVPERLSRLRQHGDAKTLRDNERAMLEVRSVVRRHAKHRPVMARARALYHMQSRLAYSACAAALAAHFAGEQKQCLEALARALVAFPPIALRKPFAGALLRATLPRRARERLFVRP